MGLPMIVSKSIILWTFMGFVKCQDPQNYFFTPSNQGQNRFVPSYQNPRTQNFLGGSRNSLTSAASTYPEQLIFLNNNDGDQSTSQLSPGYSPFAQHLPLQQTTRNPDYYDISPRPFGSAAGSQGFTRPKTLRTSGSSGFIPLSGHQTRTNVPHQQSHFLSHFNEQQSAPINAPVAATSNFPSNRINGGGRPFGSGTGNTSGFSRNRPFGGTQYNRQLQQQQQNKQTTTFDDELVTPPQQQLPFRNTRTRFQPSSAKTSTTTTTTTSSTTSKPSRYNRFGSGARSPSTQSGSSEFRQTVGSALQTLPSRGRLPVTSVNKTLFQPRRPVIISRESNRPYGIGSSAGRITVNHNGSDKGSPNSTNSLEEDDLDESSQDESVPEEIHEQNHVSQGPKEELFEKLSLHEAGASVAPSSSSSAEQQSPDEKHQHDQPVILTSNFYLPGSDDDEEGGGEEELANHSGEVEEEVENSKEGSASKEHELPETTHHHQGEYDYEYEDGNVTSTQSAETEFTEPATEMEQNTEAKVDQVKVEVPKTELSTESEATPAVEVTTMQSPESTAFYDEDEYEDGLGSGVNDSGVDGSGVESTKEDGSGADGSGTDGSGEVSEEITAKQPNKEFVGREVVSVVTTKSVINGSTAFPQPVTPSTTTMMEEDLYTENKLTPAKESAESAEEQNVQNTTESYVVIASIQTSRSINGARFLPFPAIEQEETKQTLSELERKIHGKNSRKKTPLSANDSNENGSSGEMDDSPSTNTTVSSTAERPANEEPDEEEEEEKSVSVETTTPTTTSTTASRFVPNIRKFILKSASKPKINTEDLPMDDLTGLLPPGFKPRPSFKNKKLNKPTTTTTPEPSSIEETRKPQRNSTIGRSFKNSPNAAQDVALAGLLPKGYRTTHAPVGPTEPPTKKLDDLLSKIKFEDNLDKLVPADYKLKATTPKPPVTFVDDISKFLPPGFKLPSTTTTTSTTSKPAIKFADDISKFLPPGFKAPADEKPELKVAVADDISKFLPPGFKLDKAPKEEAIDISKLLPKDYKPLAKEVPVVKKTETTVASEVNSTEKASTTKAVPTTTAAPTGGLKVVFPKGFNNRRSGQRLTTPHSNSAEAAGPTQPSIVIKKGPPQRATTEFTGWPTPSTTPISIEKLLEQARTATVDISDLLPQTSTSSTTSTTSTTTTTTEPPRPTKPGHCKSDCDLAGTIKIIDGVSWKPELLDHNTAEWKNLAREVEAQLNEVYSNAPHLNQWYKKVRIDSFSKGSVLVDYFVELGNITQDVDTLEIKKLFHQALTQPPLPVVPLQPDVENKTDSHQESASHEGKGEKLVKETYLMGRFVVDPSSTDFIVIPKSFAPTVEFAEDEALIPHWAIVLIVIGIGSLCFVVIFGVTVLINRQKNSKKTPMPLTADMMNDLKVNHMGGADNYGVDDFYNIDDAWNDTKQPIKPKRFTNSMHGSSASNIYDSWRSTRHGDYYYDSHNYTPHNKADQYPSDAFADVHQMYTYNNPRSRYQRDYDPDF